MIMQISIIKKSDIQEARRFDAEFFKPEYLNLFKNVKKFQTVSLKELATISDGDHSKFPVNQKQEVRYLQAKDIKDDVLRHDKPVYVSREYFNKQKRSHIFGLNILISIMGSIGDIVLTPDNFKACLANRAICIIKDIKNVNPYYLYTYFRTDIADKNIQRIKKGGIQERINLELLSEIIIPILSQSFQLQIEKIVKLAYQKRDRSKQLYEEAEEMLLRELDLLEYKPKHILSFETTKKEADKATRFDAEYFQYKYKEMIKKIENYKNGWDYIRNLGKFVNGSFISDKYYSEWSKRAYIRIKELSLNRLIEKNKMVFISNDFDNTNETTIKENDFVFATIGNTIGKVNLVMKEFVGSFISNNTSKFTLKKIENPFYYELLFRSIIFQNQIQREFTQTAQPKISNMQLSQIKIPLMKLQIQKEISGKIQKSYKLRKESNNLLEEAKIKVEQEIERTSK